MIPSQKTLPMYGMLVVEINSHCNRACSWCMRHGDTQERRFTDSGLPVISKMPSKRVEDLLLEASEMHFAGPVTFYLMSEPYLDDRLVEFSKRARELGMKPFINTNGDALRKSPQLLQGSSVFEWVEVGVYESDPAKASKEVAWWRSVLPNVRFKGLDQMGPRPHVPRLGRTFPDAKCLRPAEKLIIQYDGSSPLCCYDINTEFELPNAFSTSLEQLWYCEQRQDAYTRLAMGQRRDFRICSTCPMPETGFPEPFGGKF